MKVPFDFSLARWRSVFLLLTLMGLCGGCSRTPAVPSPAGPAPLPPLSGAPPIEFSITEISLEEAEPYYQDPISHEQLSGIKSITRSGFKSVHILPRFGPEDGELTSGVYLVMPPGKALVGYLRLVPTLTYPHEFGLLATLNYVPIPLQFNGQVQDLPRLHLERGSERAFRFRLPALPEGLYTLVLTLIIEPEYEFDISTPGKPFDPVQTETQSFRSAPFEFGLLLWVTAQEPHTPLDWPEQARYLPPEETMGHMDTTMVKAKPTAGEYGVLLTRDTVRAGESVTYYARFAAPPSTATADIPIRTLVFWDDHPTQSDLLAVPPQVAMAADYVPYVIWVPDLAEGEHTLMVLAYPYPYYLRWWQGGSEWHPEASTYSMLLTRIPVTVVAP